MAVAHSHAAAAAVSVMHRTQHRALLVCVGGSGALWYFGPRECHVESVVPHWRLSWLQLLSSFDFGRTHRYCCVKLIVPHLCVCATL